MASYHDLPTKEQIAAIEDIEALEDIRDEVDRAIAQIETRLEYGEGDEEWAERARNALAFHRYTGALLERRLKALRPRTGYHPTNAPKANPFGALAAIKTVERRALASPETQRAIDGEIPAAEDVPEDHAALTEAVSKLTALINAIKDDRDAEILLHEQCALDNDFLARVAVALRRASAARQSLLQRAGAISRKAKAEIQAHRDATRPEAFIDAAREVLDRATFLAIWEVVDRRQLQTAKAA